MIWSANSFIIQLTFTGLLTLPHVMLKDKSIQFHEDKYKGFLLFLSTINL